MECVNVCYYPTTVVFVDDNASFVDSLPLKLSDWIAHKGFVDPAAALEYINEKNRNNPLRADQCIEPDADEDSFGVKLNVDGIRAKVRDRHRFFEPSVLVVDYSMALMDGLEFCARVDDPHVRKVLLTGVADEKIGVEALNENIINYYIKKSTPGVFSKINKLIPELQQAYFFSMSRVVRDNLTRTVRFLDDPNFVRYFDQVRRRLGIVEYYFIPHPTRFLMLTARGDPYELLVYGDDEIQAHYDIAEDYEAPPAMLHAIQDRSSIPYFHSQTDGFYHYGIDDWQAYFFPAERVDCGEPCYCAVIDSPQFGSPDDLLAYEQHLRRMVA